MCQRSLSGVKIREFRTFVYLFSLSLVSFFIMTLEQQEQKILALLQHLPPFQRVRIALSILNQVNPEEVSISDTQSDPWMTSELRAELDKRSADIYSGQVAPISGDEFLRELRALRKG